MSGIGTVKWDINIFFDHINSTVHGMIVMFIFTMTQLVRVTCVWADIGNEPEPSWLSLVDNESKLSNFFSSAERKIRNTPLVGLNTFSMCWLIICAGIFFFLFFIIFWYLYLNNCQNLHSYQVCLISNIKTWFIS